MITFSESVGQWLDAADPICERFDGFVEIAASRWPNDLETRNPAVFFDSKFHEHGIFGSRRCERRRLDPFAIKAVVQHAAVPAELRFSPAGATRAVAKRGPLAATGLSSWRFL